jgi:type I restriction enzyme, S subunit
MNLLEKHFDIAFAAPDGIKKLRELILTLAMQGKLVLQDPNDQPASELLKEIEAEKKRLVKDGKIKQSKALPEIKPNELPYNLPKNWEWVRLGCFGTWKSGTTPSRTNHAYYDGEIPWVKSGEVKQGKIRETEEKITHEALQKCSLELNSIGSILVAMYGANIGEVGVLEIEATTNQAVCACRTFSGIDNIFLLHLIISLKQNFLTQGAGAAQPNISREKIINTVVPLPPLEEQRRIVAKIDELMARCDELEKLRGDRNRSLTTVHTAALNRLLMAKESSNFSTAWSFITQHFGELYSVKENVAELRKAILQLAVMGKLVPQDPNDDPASELLKAIVVEKQRLVKEGKIKEQKPLSAIMPEEMPYLLPNSWEWVRFEDIVDISSGVTKGRKLNGKEMLVLPYLRVANVQRGYLNLDVIKDIEIAKDEIERFELKKKDLLITEGGDWDKVGRTAIWNAEIPQCIHQNHIFKARRLLSEQNEKWLEKYLNSFVARAYFANASKQTTNLASINKTQLRGCPIPMPPLTEQHRIVDKIDQLMGLCDQLEQQIDAAKVKQTLAGDKAPLV